jgi:hypothetical protein
VSAAAALGIGLYAAVLGAAVLLLLRRAQASHVLAPLIAALVVRLVVMAVAHVVSVSQGDGGFFYLDDKGYDLSGRQIAEQWRDGNLIDIRTKEYTGSLAFGYEAFVAGIYTLVGNHPIAVKLANVVLSAASVLLAAKLGRDVLGAAAQRRVAWLVGLWPMLVWWSATMLKEALVGFLLLATLVAAFRFPRLQALAAAAAAFTMLAITRAPVAIAVGLALVAGFGLAAFRRRRDVDRRALGMLGGGALALVLVTIVAVGRGDPIAVLAQFEFSVRHITQFYGTGNPVDVPLDVARTLAAPHPWVFDAASHTWDRALYPGMWLWYALLPAAAFGAWRLRRTLDAVLVAVPIAVVLILDAFLVGPAFRQRSTIEPLVLVLVIAGFTSWRALLLLASSGLLLAAASSLFQSRQPLVAALIAAAAFALAALSRIVSRQVRDLEIAQTSHLESSLVALRLPGARPSSQRRGSRSSPRKHSL